MKKLTMIILMALLAAAMLATLVATASAEGQATIYIYRLSGLVGDNRGEPVFIDGRMLGQNSQRTFLVTHVSAGHHTVATTTSSLTLDADVGKAYFIRQQHSVWNATSSIGRVTEEEGKKGLIACKRASELF